jgi:hypothetical protein
MNFVQDSSATVTVFISLQVASTVIEFADKALNRIHEVFYAAVGEGRDFE